jgi:cytidylate kinase
MVLIAGEHPGEALRSDEVNAAVSRVAAVPEVRHLLVARQRELRDLGDLVMEGRDIGSVVFPDTPYKLYIEASEEVRHQRRAAEGQVDEVALRDRQDSARRTSPLVVADGAQVIDSSKLNIEQVLNAAMEVLREQGWFERNPESATP